MLILPTQGKDFLRRCCTYFGIGGALILELTIIRKLQKEEEAETGKEAKSVKRIMA